MRLSEVFEKGSKKLALMTVLTVALLSATVTAMREWYQQREQANLKMLAQTYAELLEDKLVQIEADLIRSSASNTFLKNAYLLQERMPWLVALQERDNKANIIFQINFTQTQSSSFELLALSLLEGASSVGHLFFGDIQTTAHGDEVSCAAWPINATDHFGLVCISVPQLVQSINLISKTTLNVEAELVSNKKIYQGDDPHFQQVRLNYTGLTLPLRISTTEGISLTSSWQILGLPVLAFLLACAIALYVREILLRQRAESIAREQQDRIQINSRFATLGEISAMISHEINQPLAAIELYAATCDKILKSGAHQPETMEQALHGVRSQTERVSRIIRSVQDFAQSRSETPQGVDVMAVIRDLAPLIDLQAKRTKAIVKVQGMTGTLIVADKTMMEQVILNLVRNGLEAMRNTPEDKRLLTIEVSKVDSWLSIRIADQGSGIAPELKDRIFSAFVTNKPRGTGVGLSLCKSLVEKHRGRISFSDNPNGGTIFTVDLPLDATKSPEPQPIKSSVRVAL
jgi:signal transduction histidine kinase